MDMTRLPEFGKEYTAAWCSRDPASVAAVYAENGSLTINDGVPSVGRAAIAAAAQGFMSAFPDMIVKMDSVSLEGNHAVYRWILTGTHTGPGGTGKAVPISGHEEWVFDADGLIAESKGHFDEAEYKRQLQSEVSSSKAHFVAEMTGFLGCLLLLGGLALAAFWLLFMSWSHSFASPGFRRDEALVQGGAVVGVVGGVVLMVWAWRRLSADGTNLRDQHK
jgi:uncharacterized protein (TIGR02246 family)